MEDQNKCHSRYPDRLINPESIKQLKNMKVENDDSIITNKWKLPKSTFGECDIIEVPTSKNEEISSSLKDKKLDKPTYRLMTLEEFESAKGWVVGYSKMKFIEVEQIIKEHGGRKLVRDIDDNTLYRVINENLVLNGRNLIRHFITEKKLMTQDEFEKSIADGQIIENGMSDIKERMSSRIQGYSYNPDKIEISSGMVKLKDSDNKINNEKGLFGKSLLETIIDDNKDETEKLRNELSKLELEVIKPRISKYKEILSDIKRILSANISESDKTEQIGRMIDNRMVMMEGESTDKEWHVTNIYDGDSTAKGVNICLGEQTNL